MLRWRPSRQQNRLIYDEPDPVSVLAGREGEVVAVVIKYVHIADTVLCSCKILTDLQCDALAPAGSWCHDYIGWQETLIINTTLHYTGKNNKNKISKHLYLSQHLLL